MLKFSMKVRSKFIFYARLYFQNSHPKSRKTAVSLLEHALFPGFLSLFSHLDSYKINIKRIQIYGD